jgi:hypothetical protein
LKFVITEFVLAKLQKSKKSIIFKKEIHDSFKLFEWPGKVPFKVFTINYLNPFLEISSECSKRLINLLYIILDRWTLILRFSTSLGIFDLKFNRQTFLFTATLL